MKIYVVETSTDLDDCGVWYVERRCYTSEEAAKKRADEYRSVVDDGIYQYAHVVELELVDELQSLKEDRCQTR